MSAHPATAVKSAQKAQRELEDLQLVVKARNGSQPALDALMRRYTGFVRLKASSYFLAGGDVGGPRPGGPDRPLQGGPRLPRRQGDLVPELRRALRDAADHHRDQDGDPLQAPAAEPVHLVQPHAGGSGLGGRVHARRRAPGPVDERPVRVRDLDARSCRASSSRSAPASRGSRPRRCAATSRASPTRRWRTSSAATARRSTTPSSASSVRSWRTRRRARC